jgi:hypothetical protein
MPKVQVVDRTPVSPEKVLEAARDFSDRRSELWPDVHPELFDLHRSGDRFAEVTEGNPSPIGPFWERLRYDWSEPGSIKGVVLDSNIFKPGSTWEITAAAADGGTRVAVTMVRNFKGLKGRLVGPIMVRTGLAKRTSAAHLRHFLAQLETQGSEPPKAAPAACRGLPSINRVASSIAASPARSSPPRRQGWSG